MFDSSKKDIIPLYSRVANIMQHKILSGQYDPGERLPTEDDLVSHYQVSKITIRNALSLLEAEGLITRSRGKGTFVTENVPVIKQTVHTSLSEMMHSLPESQVKPLEIATIKINETRTPKDICSFFNKDNTDEIARIRRLVTRENVTYFYENYLMPDIAKHISKKELVEIKSITKILYKKIGLTISKGEMYLQAISAEHDISQFLDCQAFEPLIHVQTYFWSESGQPFEIINRYLRACFFKYKVDVEISDGSPR